MAKQTVLEEVNARMEELLEKKTADLNKIADMQIDARTKIEAAGLAMKHATEVMDVDAYAEAKQNKGKAQIALDMYTGRYNQIKAQEIISERESDKVIKSLLAYEDTLAADFKAAAGEHLKALVKILEGYKEAVQDTELTLSRWQRDIHANYISETTTYYDEVTGTHTNRSKNPVPVHAMAYTGCKEATQLEDYLKKAGMKPYYTEQ